MSAYCWREKAYQRELAVQRQMVLSRLACRRVATHILRINRAVWSMMPYKGLPHESIGKLGAWTVTYAGVGQTKSPRAPIAFLPAADCPADIAPTLDALDIDTHMCVLVYVCHEDGAERSTFVIERTKQ